MALEHDADLAGFAQATATYAAHHKNSFLAVLMTLENISRCDCRYQFSVGLHRLGSDDCTEELLLSRSRVIAFGDYGERVDARAFIREKMDELYAIFSQNHRPYVLQSLGEGSARLVLSERSASPDSVTVFLQELKSSL